MWGFQDSASLEISGTPSKFKNLRILSIRSEVFGKAKCQLDLSGFPGLKKLVLSYCELSIPALPESLVSLRCDSTIGLGNLPLNIKSFQYFNSEYYVFDVSKYRNLRRLTLRGNDGFRVRFGANKLKTLVLDNTFGGALDTKPYRLKLAKLHCNFISWVFDALDLSYLKNLKIDILDRDTDLNKCVNLKKLSINFVDSAYVKFNECPLTKITLTGFQHVLRPSDIPKSAIVMFGNINPIMAVTATYNIYDRNRWGLDGLLGFGTSLSF